MNAVGSFQYARGSISTPSRTTLNSDSMPITGMASRPLSGGRRRPRLPLLLGSDFQAVCTIYKPGEKLLPDSVSPEGGNCVMRQRRRFSATVETARLLFGFRRRSRNRAIAREPNSSSDGTYDSG